MTPLLRYTLLQLPGLGFVALTAFCLWRWADVPGWLALALIAAWAAKDAVAYPFLRRAYGGPGGPGTARLVGQLAIARRELAPEGYVAVGSELWRAELEPGEPPVAAGRPVRIVGARGLTLVVRSDPAADPHAWPR
jgi:membrane protein implicated in regulation of membrane protease activity